MITMPPLHLPPPAVPLRSTTNDNNSRSLHHYGFGYYCSCGRGHPVCPSSSGGGGAK
jgi:hypothetical protein